MTGSSAQVVRLHQDDNVVVANAQIHPGMALATEGLVSSAWVSSGHKIATAAVEAGAPIRKYGQVIGFASVDIQPGEHVHVHNCTMGDLQLDYEFCRDARETVPIEPANTASFSGYVRDGERVGTRNYIGILSTVNCSATVARAIAAELYQSGRCAEFSNVDGVVPIVHSSGCGMATDGEGFRILQRTLWGYATHPNFAGVLMIGLGCEANQIPVLLDNYGLKPGDNFQVMTIQGSGGTRRSIAEGVERIEAMLPRANAAQRESLPAGHLTLALQCGGSDGYSGITANPALGVAADTLVRHGGSVILSETPEIYGAEHLLVRRAANREVAEKLVGRIRWWEDYTRRLGAEMNNNPSPGNKAGGLTTILEKSLGAAAKGGSTRLEGVYEYAESLRTRGFNFMDSPGYDPCSVTGQVASGANLVCFTTGRGSVFGFKPVPSIKIATNNELYRRMTEDMDVNCGEILGGDRSVEDMGAEIFSLALRVASGEASKSEALGFGDSEVHPLADRAGDVDVSIRRMIAEDQSEVIQFLTQPNAYGSCGPVEQVDTHGAVVFLVDDRAYKLKRAVRFPYMDFSTVERRREMCEAELVVNRRTAPRHYLGVAAVTRAEDGLHIGGSGEALDWLVVMRRFDQERLLDRLAERGELDESVMPKLAQVIVDFHRCAEVKLGFGDIEAIKALIGEIEASFGDGAAVFLPGSVDSLMAKLRYEARCRGDLLTARDEAGFVRHCHGDLHLGNIFLDDGEPCLFDAIEFSETLACNDILYDLAFVLMDIEQRGLRDHANLLLNGYLHRTGDYQGLRTLPLYLSLRAAIRAHVSATMAVSRGADSEIRELSERANRYLGFALGFLTPEPPRMLAIGGLSGSGKSTLARGLAPMLGSAPGAVVLRSDLLRKELMGADEFEKLSSDAYCPEVSKRVYARALERAQWVLEAGQSIVVDAVFSRPGDRRAVEETARQAGVPFDGIWLVAPPTVLETRVAARGEDASDATVEVVRDQIVRETGMISWPRLDASLSRTELLRAAQRLLRKQ